MTQMSDLLTILPVFIVVIWAVLLLLIDLWIPKGRKGITALLAVLGLATALGVDLAIQGQTSFAFNQMVVLDGFSSFLQVVILASGITAIALAYDYLKRMDIEHGEYYVLLLFSIAGMMLMTQAYNLLMVFLSLELLSIPLYVLAGFARSRTESEEAALKYFMLGAFASGFVLYGSAMIFGSTGAIDFPGIVAALNNGSANLILFVIGAALLLVGFGFKVAAVPFQMWTPDVYQGAPSSITAFMSVAVKAAGFAVLLRVFLVLFPSLADKMTPVLWMIAVLTMLVGNVVALAQNNIKRLLAYSSIAHAGYILMAFVGYGNGEVATNSISSALFYLVAYGLTSFGAWALVIAIEKEYGKGLMLEDLSGLGKRYPWLGAAMLIFMLSFAGVPLTMGFWGKFYLFRTAVQAGNVSLALIGLLTSLVSAFYYLRIIVYMFMKPGDRELHIDKWVSLVLVVTALAVVALAVFPGLIFEWAAQAVMLLQ
ncbi:MAG: NADH-quinone oxidoreductase subunit N [Chloroflexi bacterium HGW-Chloroflexi-8]|jgi:NADH-quinone oxidoreductase subunit N|nr:MAG: NADH-quinone oxidoreductase subunit N [Chloroflexi bacterium HGW-Chloroflexi-8]